MTNVREMSVWAVMSLIVAISSVAWAVDTPQIESPVTDHADVISETVEARLGERLEQHYEETGVQMAVLTVPSTAGEPIEDFSFRVADDWGGGLAGQDRGILLTLAVDDRRSRLEVGYGLEGVYSDVRSARALRRIRPSLRAGEYDAAVEQVVTDVLDATDHLEAGRRAGLLDIHPLWNGAIGMLLITLLGLVMVGAPAVVGAEKWVDWSQTQTTLICLVMLIAGAVLTYWLAQGIAPWGYLAMFVAGGIGGLVLAVSNGVGRVAPFAAFFLILCMVAVVPAFNGGMPHEPDGKMLFFAIFYAAGALFPLSTKWDTQPYGGGLDDSGFSSGGSSSGGGYSGGGGSFGGGGASGSW